MTKLIIYKSTLVYAALYLKRSAEPDGPITLTEKEFQDYFNHLWGDLNDASGE